MDDESEVRAIFPTPDRKPKPKSWRIVSKNLAEDYGFCHWDERVIDIDALERSPRKRIGHVLHESAHAAMPDLRERVIIRLVKAQMACLDAIGLLPEDD